MPDDTGMITANSLICWQICQKCRLVSFSQGSLERQHINTSGNDSEICCPICHADPSQKRPYFDSSLSVALSFIQRAYQTKQNLEVVDTLATQATDQYPVSILVFLGVLQELLLDHLLSQLAQTQKTPEADRLLTQYQGYAQKQRLLFPQLAGMNWDAAMSNIQGGATFNCLEFNHRLKQLDQLKQRFIYLAYGWNISHQQALDCLNSVEPLINLHVLLHNHLVHPCYPSILSQE